MLASVTPIYKLRRALGLSQHKFGELVGRSYASIQGYEAGKRVPVHVLDRMADIAAERDLTYIADELRAMRRRPRKPPGWELERSERHQRLHGLVDQIAGRGDEELERLLIGLLERLAG